MTDEQWTMAITLAHITATDEPAVVVVKLRAAFRLLDREPTPTIAEHVAALRADGYHELADIIARHHALPEV
jgi:hypothetical protein